MAGRPYENVKGLSKTGIPATTIEKITPLVTTLSRLPRRNRLPRKRRRPLKLRARRRRRINRVARRKRQRTTSTPPRQGMVWVNTEYEGLSHGGKPVVREDQ